VADPTYTSVDYGGIADGGRGQGHVVNGGAFCLWSPDDAAILCPDDFGIRQNTTLHWVLGNSADGPLYQVSGPEQSVACLTGGTSA
jgi:hypothetical protein